MFRVLTNIEFTQNPTTDLPTRSQKLIYNFIHEATAHSTWENLTDSGEIIIPKNVYVKDKNGRPYQLAGSNKNIGGFETTVPLFLRGDKVTIKWGYAYFDSRDNEISPMYNVFEGYISEVTSKMPIVLKIEDNMWKLKQAPASGGNNNFFSSSYTVESMLREMITNAGLPFTVNALTNTSIGNFIVQNETIAEVLARLRKDYHFEAYFRGDELRVGSFVYLPDDVTIPYPKFVFQKNIISDELEYRRKDDIILSAVATNTIEEQTGHTTKDGHAKTKRTKLEVLVTYRNGAFESFIGTRTNKIPPNTGGERRTLHFLGATTTAELITLATNELKKYFYTGFKGKFTTFGIPFVKHGDYVDILDNVLPERNGRFVVKGVEYKGGVGGLRQEIELDYLINRLDAKGNVI